MRKLVRALQLSGVETIDIADELGECRIVKVAVVTERQQGRRIWVRAGIDRSVEFVCDRHVGPYGRRLILQ
jgi:hypothetical protein